jgi:hypothetical protein
MDFYERIEKIIRDQVHQKCSGNSSADRHEGLHQLSNDITSESMRQFAEFCGEFNKFTEALARAVVPFSSVKIKKEEAGFSCMVNAVLVGSVSIELIGKQVLVKCHFGLDGFSGASLIRLALHPLAAHHETYITTTFSIDDQEPQSYFGARLKGESQDFFESLSNTLAQLISWQLNQTRGNKQGEEPAL